MCECQVSAKLNTAVRDVFVKLLDQARLPAVIATRRGDDLHLGVADDILQRQKSANAAQRLCHKAPLKASPSKPGVKDDDGGVGGKLMGRSRSVIRRKDKPKVKLAAGDTNSSDCNVS